MEHIIAKLLQDFELGKMSRRQLIQSLALSATAASAMTSAKPAAAAGTGFKALSVNHISFDVKDYTKVRDFYSGVFGMEVFGDNTKPADQTDNGLGQCHLWCGTDTFLTVRSSKKETPRAEHIAIAVDNYSKQLVEEVTKSRGIKVDWGPTGNGSPKINDPEGYPIQIVGKGYVDK